MSYKLLATKCNKTINLDFSSHAGRSKSFVESGKISWKTLKKFNERFSKPHFVDFVMFDDASNTSVRRHHIAFPITKIKGLLNLCLRGIKYSMLHVKMRKLL